MRKKLMAEQWAQFNERVMPLDAPANQKRAMKIAFYGGAQAIMFRIIAAFSPEGEPTDDDLQVMNDLERELSDFAKDVKMGRV